MIVDFGFGGLDWEIEVVVSFLRVSLFLSVWVVILLPRSQCFRPSHVAVEHCFFYG